MIKEFNIFTYDRFLFIMVNNLHITLDYLIKNWILFKTFRSFDASDCQLSLEILNIVFNQVDYTNQNDFVNKYKDYMTVSGKKKIKLKLKLI